MLSEVANIKGRQEKIKYLRSIDHPIIRKLLRYMFDERIKFLLPEGAPPFEADKHMEVSRLWTEVRRLYLFVEGGNPNLTQINRERLFIEILESVDPDEAELLIAVKDKTSPVKTLTPKLVEEEYPGIWDEKIEELKL